jgi:hypothetical protein
LRKYWTEQERGHPIDNKNKGNQKLQHEERKQRAGIHADAQPRVKIGGNST